MSIIGYQLAKPAGLNAGLDPQEVWSGQLANQGAWSELPSFVVLSEDAARSYIEQAAKTEPRETIVLVPVFDGDIEGPTMLTLDKSGEPVYTPTED